LFYQDDEEDEDEEKEEGAPKKEKESLVTQTTSMFYTPVMRDPGESRNTDHKHVLHACNEGPR
jgi:hypothetical protein